MLLFIASSETKFWTSFVFLLIVGLGYLGFRLTKGFIGGYLHANIGDRLKTTLLITHGLGSAILALVLPNNYLVDIDFFRSLYDESELWIAASILTLLFVFLLLFGAILTFLTIGKIRNIKSRNTPSK